MNRKPWFLLAPLVAGFACGVARGDGPGQPQLTVEATNARVTFGTVVGRSYAVERSDNLSRGNLTQLGAEIAGDGAEHSVSDSGAGALARRFYRVRSGEAMVLIPAGSFQMGNSMNASEGGSDELPVHTVYVSARSTWTSMR